VCKEAINNARKEGRKVALVRPISLWPFPSQVLGGKAERGCRFLVIEDCLGQMVDDVRMSVLGRAEVNFMGVLSRHIPTDGGMILPGRILEEIRRLT
jgi:2-oxoglutarate/2-oxoacid ferredoxin oxidoreductase subunit alpha